MPPEARQPRGESAADPSVEEIYERVRAIGRENERILGDLIAGESRFRRLAKAVWQVQEDERRRLARELHDGIGQVLTALKNHLEWMDRAPEGGERESELREAVELASQALEDTRELSRLLRPPVLDDLGLAAALRWLGRTVEKRFTIAVTVDAEELPERPETEIETVIFRIAQEALSNVAKHARASAVDVRLEREDVELVLTIVDDGTGFDVASTSRADDRTGVGLRGMKDRVELFEGLLSIHSQDGAGTRIVARVPLTKEVRP